MNQLRGTHLLEMNGLIIIRADDYLKQLSTDVQGNHNTDWAVCQQRAEIYFGGSFLVLHSPIRHRAKDKDYLGVKEDSADKATAKLSTLKEKVLALVTGLEMRSL